MLLAKITKILLIMEYNGIIHDMSLPALLSKYHLSLKN